MAEANQTEPVGYIVYFYGSFSLMFPVNLIGNIIVIFTILRHQQLRGPQNYLFVSLAISDILIGILYPLYCLGHLHYFRPTIGEWSVCIVVLPALNLVLTSSAVHLIAITVIRYISVVHSRKQHIFTPRRTLLAIVFVWVLSAALSLPFAIIERPENYENICRSETIYTSQNVWILSATKFFLPFSVMAVLYSLLLWQLWRMTKKLVPTKAVEREKRVFIMVSILLGWFAVSCLPVCIYIVVTRTNAEASNIYAGATVRLLVYSNAMVNIFIYAGRLKHFRQYLVSDVRTLWRRSAFFSSTEST